MRDSNQLGSDIYWVCFACGKEALTYPANKKKKQIFCSTFHYGVCDVCKTIKAVTEARDFGYPIFK